MSNIRHQKMIGVGQAQMRLSSDQLPVRYRAIPYSRRNNFPNDVSPDGLPDGAANARGEALAGFWALLVYRRSGSWRIHRGRTQRFSPLLCTSTWSLASRSMNRPQQAIPHPAAIDRRRCFTSYRRNLMQKDRSLPVMPRRYQAAILLFGCRRALHVSNF
jgi:hypothetical protein